MPLPTILPASGAGESRDAPCLARPESFIFGVKLTKERRTYLAILGLGAAAVGVDRLWLNAGPSSVSASMPDVVASAGLPGAVGAGGGPTTTGVSVSRRLESLAATLRVDRVDDAFQLPLSWLPPAEAAIEAPAPGGPLSPRVLPRVTGIVGRGASIAAVIDGEVVVLGETSSKGVTLVGVEGQDVTVEVAGERVTLSRDTPAAGR